MSDLSAAPPPPPPPPSATAATSAPPPPPAPAARAAPAPASAPTPLQVEPSARDLWSASPQARHAEQLRQTDAGDPWRSGTDTVLTYDEQGRLLKNGRRVDGTEPAPGEPPASEPAADKPKIRIGDSVNGFEATEDEIKSWRTAAAAEQSRRANIPVDASLYQATLPDSWKPPETFKDYKLDTSHPVYLQAREFAHRHGLDQAAFSEMLALSATREVGTAQLLDRARSNEISKLGVNASLRVTAVQDYIRSVAG
jgi:hypothetical protein